MKPIQTIPLRQIDLSDQTFSVNFMPDVERLRSSVKAAGFIQPVLLREKPHGYQIVSGFRRISVARELGYDDVEARIFGEKEMEDLKLFLISLQENLTTRGLNAIEKAIALEKLIDHFKIDPLVVTREFLPLFDLETNEKILNTFLSLARVEEEVKRYVLKEEVSRTNIRRLVALNVEDRKAVLVLLTPLKLGENSLREVLTLLEEITRRNQWAAKKVVDLPEIEAILTYPDLTSSQKTERVKKALMTLRYPRMSQLEEEFEKKRKDLSLSSRISLHHSPFFEGKGLRMEFQFASIEEYRSILSSLSSLVDKKAFKEIVET
ncbi:MAG TPA: ParB/RepB/Spo0J family partition protein [Thermodesulfobacteriota bacterium]|nr:ParB/RepB/Spo0J family partition protein [Thermodesulfobacteriota bacterium]